MDTQLEMRSKKHPMIWLRSLQVSSLTHPDQGSCNFPLSQSEHSEVDVLAHVIVGAREGEEGRGAEGAFQSQHI